MKVWFLLTIASLCLLLFSVSLFQSTNPFDHNYYTVEIPQGTSTVAAQRLLEEAGILKPDSSFAAVTKVLFLSKNIQAGAYRFSPSETLWGILQKLVKGEVVPAEQVQVTFPEGTSIYKMGEILKAAGFPEPSQFQALVDEGITPPLRKRHWAIFKYIPTESLEGYLYPDTYWIFTNAKTADVTEKMIARFERVILPFWRKAAKDTKYNLHEILTLASIIEKEAQAPAERPIISSVFHNRLKARLPLAADPTIKYALERPTKIVYLDQLSIDSPYNTYKKYGLPPGPICNPGIESIKAAVYPAQTSYYYFVANKDGAHIFSRTWQEHQKARQQSAK